jgi:Fe-S oxidoreductase
MLDTAKSMLSEILDTLRPWIEAGTPIVGLEPSCIAVFRDELHSFFPKDDNSSRLQAQSFLLSEFLNKHAPHFQPPELPRRAIVHGHCHHKALMKMDDEEAVLKKAGVDYQELDSGCCGMAGSFGFEANHYDISLQIGERVLLPAVRAADKDTLIIAEGFSCREQIEQATGRGVLHPAQVLQLALHQHSRRRPDRLNDAVHSRPNRGRLLTTGATFAAGALSGAALLWLWKGRKTP